MANRLARETSPYLLQHAENPVDWLPWSDEALDKARRENKPILLSIGYSACHWCHVMAHESFEDEETAELMNRLYVNIKVDREERPDLDKIYQTAHQLFTGRAGGWPLTVFLTPDTHIPIVVGTYFPKEPRYGMPSFKDVLTQIEAYYRNYADEIRTRGSALLEAFARMESAAGDALPTRAPLDLACERLVASFDRDHGGFGGAPKFPRPNALALLLEEARRAAEPSRARELEHVVLHTLTRMARGGLYDHLGGGFFRYSVDRRWSIPHFEKMLSDNGALLALYADAHAATGDASFARVAAETAGWLIREMQDPGGAFYSALDADAAGREGGFYVFTHDEVDQVLTGDEADAAKRVFGLDREPNFEDPHGGGKAWHLQIVEPVDALGESDAERLERARRKLLDARERRVRPACDDKILAGWNGLAIRGLARAARRLERADLADAATRAADFIRTRMWQGNRLIATYRDGRARFAAYLDDYAFVADALLELLECRWRREDLDFAVALVDTALEHFEDHAAGGFFFTADDHEKLIHRPKPFADESVPSGNGVLCRVLIGLGHLLGEQRYLDAAERTLKAAMPMLAQYPDAHASLLIALERHLEPPEAIVVRADAADVPRVRALVAKGYRPGRSSFVIPNDEADLPGLLAERTGRAGGIVAYVCRGTACLAPITSVDALAAELA
ncbi:MAG TPA: thioredoxin domain-containing protein [Gammaproteobacteria bacterium]